MWINKSHLKFYISGMRSTSWTGSWGLGFHFKARQGHFFHFKERLIIMFVVLFIQYNLGFKDLPGTPFYIGVHPASWRQLGNQYIEK